MKGLKLTFNNLLMQPISAGHTYLFVIWPFLTHFIPIYIVAEMVFQTVLEQPSTVSLI